MFQGQNVEELEQMQREIRATLSQQLDREYWENVLKALRVALAAAQMQLRFKEMLSRQKERLVERSKKDKGAKAVDDEHADDARVKPPAARMNDESSEAIAMQKREEEKGMDEEEEVFNTETETKHITYGWGNKYRPRKPRYYNRVKTGIEWNKYNQTHYDEDNPPPKVVQGYKFNLFYPDLIDKTATPTFYLEKAPSKEFCIIRFRAGPPYEDIAFQIVNREWEYSQKRGFKSVFERGILHLYFNFRRQIYRR